MVTGVFAEGNIIKTSNGGAGTIAGNGEGLYETTDRYFGGIVAHHTTEPIVDIGTFDWTVQATGLTVDEFRLATSTNPVFRRSGVIVDPGSITLTSSPTRNADLIYYQISMFILFLVYTCWVSEYLSKLSNWFITFRLFCSHHLI